MLNKSIFSELQRLFWKKLYKVFYFLRTAEFIRLCCRYCCICCSKRYYNRCWWCCRCSWRSYARYYWWWRI